MSAYDTRQEIAAYLPDEPGIHVTTGRGEIYSFSDDGPVPQMTQLGAAVLVTRLRWWADEIERRARTEAIGLTPERDEAGA